MRGRTEIEKVRDEFFQLAEELCPHKGKDHVITGMEAIKQDGTISMKRRVWMDGFVKAVTTINKIERLTGKPIYEKHE